MLKTCYRGLLLLVQRLRTTSERFHLCVIIKGNPLPGDVAWPGNIAYKVEHHCYTRCPCTGYNLHSQS